MSSEERKSMAHKSLLEVIDDLQCLPSRMMTDGAPGLIAQVVAEAKASKTQLGSTSYSGKVDHLVRVIEAINRLRQDGAITEAAHQSAVNYLRAWSEQNGLRLPTDDYFAI